MLHLYARSLPPNGRLSGRAFERMHRYTDGHLKASVVWLEAEYGGYILVKMIENGDGADLERVDDIPEAPANAPLVIKNRNRLTLAGQIMAEIASLVSGYSALVKLAIGSRGKRPTDHANRMLLAWLREESVGCKILSCERGCQERICKGWATTCRTRPSKVTFEIRWIWPRLRFPMSERIGRCAPYRSNCHSRGGSVTDAHLRHSAARCEQAVGFLTRSRREAF